MVFYDAAVRTGRRFGDVFIRSAESVFFGISVQSEIAHSGSMRNINTAIERIEIPSETDHLKWGNWIVEASFKRGHRRTNGCLQGVVINIDEALSRLRDVR